MKQVAIACAFFSLSFHASAQNYFSCNFENGIPSDFNLIDYDQNNPSTSMQKAGFSIGTPWIASTLGTTGNNMAACSTSWYSPAGTSDDWLITPPITLSGSYPELSFKAMATDKKHADGFVVYISTTDGTQRTDFDMATPLLTVANENAELTVHSVSLADYKGKTIRLAFVNNSTDCSRLFIDDIDISEHHKGILTLTSPLYINYTGEATIKGTVTTRESAAINGFTLTLEAQGETTTQHFDNTVSSTEPIEFELDKKLNVGKLEKVDYKLTLTADGDENSVESSITSYPRKAVCEEGTGTWCGYCVRGLVMLDSIKNNYADKIIGIAAHSGDAMQSNYVNYVSKYFGSGYPTGTVCRMVTADPKDFIRYSEILLNNNEPFTAISLSTEFDKATRTVTATTTTTFAETHADNNYALAYAIIENNVHKPGDDDYRQHNSYANGALGEMGGYEKYDEYIPSEVMYYNDVARGYIDDLSGIDGSIPSTVSAGETVTDERTFTLPDNIIVDDNVEIVALLIDKKDGHIINAEAKAIAESPSAIRNMTDTTVSNGKTTIYNISGMRQNALSHGLNIVKTSNGKAIKVAK